MTGLKSSENPSDTILWSIAELSITPVRLRSLSVVAAGSWLDILSLRFQVCSVQNCYLPRYLVAFALWQESSKFLFFRRCLIQTVPFALLQTMNLLPWRTCGCIIFHLPVWRLLLYLGRSQPSESHRWSSIEIAIYLACRNRTSQGLQLKYCACSSWFWRNPRAAGIVSVYCWGERTLAFEEADQRFLSSRVCNTLSQSAREQRIASLSVFDKLWSTHLP